MVWQGVWCNFGLILCKNSLKLHKNKNFCISDFSKNLTFLTNLANILNFICQICKFFKQSSPTSQPSVARWFIKILKSHTSICKTKSTPFLACTCLFFLYKSIARIPPFIIIGCGCPTHIVILSMSSEATCLQGNADINVATAFFKGENRRFLCTSIVVASNVVKNPA